MPAARTDGDRVQPLCGDSQGPQRMEPMSSRVAVTTEHTRWGGVVGFSEKQNELCVCVKRERRDLLE